MNRENMNKNVKLLEDKKNIENGIWASAIRSLFGEGTKQKREFRRRWKI
jgi:hypothetical protein